MPDRTTTTPDASWRTFVDSGDEAAFRHLVEHYYPVVHASARGVLNGNATLADDVAQLVFIDFARSASILPRKTVLGAWLCRRASWTASKMVRGETRRQRREQRAQAMADPSNGEGAEVQAIVDELLGQLPEKDRAALLLRYVDGHGIDAVGERLGISRAAVQKRIERCLNRIRRSAKGAAPLTASLAFCYLSAEIAESATVVDSITRSAILAGKTQPQSLALGFLKNAPALQHVAIGIALVLIVTLPFAAWSWRKVMQLEAELATSHEPPPAPESVPAVAAPPLTENETSVSEPTTTDSQSVAELVRRMIATIEKFGYSLATARRLEALGALLSPEQIGHSLVLLKREVDPTNPYLLFFFKSLLSRWQPAGTLSEIEAFAGFLATDGANIWVESLLKNNLELAHQIVVGECQDDEWLTADSWARTRIMGTLSGRLFSKLIVEDPETAVKLIDSSSARSKGSGPFNHIKLDPDLSIEKREELVDAFTELSYASLQRRFISHVIVPLPVSERMRIIDDLEDDRIRADIATEITRRLVRPSKTITYRNRLRHGDGSRSSSRHETYFF
jgi:RNA polymerase sigma factor (sigma-70 family)